MREDSETLSSEVSKNIRFGSEYRTLGLGAIIYRDLSWNRRCSLMTDTTMEVRRNVILLSKKASHIFEMLAYHIKPEKLTR